MFWISLCLLCVRLEASAPGSVEPPEKREVGATEHDESMLRTANVNRNYGENMVGRDTECFVRRCFSRPYAFQPTPSPSWEAVHLELGTPSSCISAVAHLRINAVPTKDIFHGCYGLKDLLLNINTVRASHARCRGFHAGNYAFVSIQAQIKLDLLNTEQQVSVVVDYAIQTGER